MTNPTPLSPAAQAVLDAFNLEARPEPHHQREAIAAALRAAAKELRVAYANEQYVDPADDWLDDIAAELDPPALSSPHYDR